MLQTEAIVVREVNGPFTVEPVQLRDDSLLPSEVIVELKATGICACDVAIADFARS